MANLLDETKATPLAQGRDIHVIQQQIPVTTGLGSILFQIALWITFPLLSLLAAMVLEPFLEFPSFLLIIAGVLLGILSGIVFEFKKIAAHNYFQQLEQRIQAEASNIDNYLEQRVQILQNVVGLVERSIELDKDVMKSVAALRSGKRATADRNERNAQIERVAAQLFPQVEAYPNLKSQDVIADALQQNSYLQREITAARTIYNSRVTQWNTDIFDWPARMIVAARQGYTTRLPFTASAEVKLQARSKFF